MLSGSQIVQRQPHSATQRNGEDTDLCDWILAVTLARICSIVLLSRLSVTTHLQEDHLGRSLHLAENFSQVSQR